METCRIYTEAKDLNCVPVQSLMDALFDPTPPPTFVPTQ